MKPLLALVALSLSANLVMAGWWLNSRPGSAPSLASAPKATSAGAPKSGARFTADPHGPRPSEPISTATGVVQAVTSWSDIESADLKEFVRRLRAVACPEETVQDIIVAEVNRRYATRIRELWPERYVEKPFWETQNRQRDRASAKENRERWRQERDLQKEKSALLVELLGVDPEKELRKAEGYDEPMDWMTQRIAFLPEAKREAVQKYLDEFEDKMQDFYARSSGLWDAETRAEQKQLEAERLQGLARFLAPTELREYELRNSQLASQLNHDLRSLSLTRDQYEIIYDIRKKYGDSIYNYGDDESKDAPARAERSKKALNEELAASLGPEKAREYARGQDYGYEQLTRISKRYDLPAGTAAQVYDFKEAAEQSAKQLRENKDLTDEARQAALQQIRAETEKSVKESLGEKGYKRYLNQGGWWINNLAPQTSPRISRVVTP